VEGDDLAAKREAVLRPKVIGEFLRQYDAAPLPSDQIAKNVLMGKGVPVERLDNVLTLILDSAQAIGFLQDISGKRWVDLTGAAASTKPVESSDSPAPPSERLGVPSGGASPVVSMSPGIHVNIEIHIAADASSQVIEDIFKNMRRYVLSRDGTLEEE
jgi:hypothetical protein